MTLDIKPYVFSDAIQHFWHTRAGQAARQNERGIGDQGARSAVTGGRQMDGFVKIIVDLLRAAGVEGHNIYYARDRELPGYFRPTKDWDLVVAADDHLLAAIELKSQVGPSFGNNFNNRTEEALGNAVDIWTAYREGAFATSPTPWLGYLFVLEDCPRSQSPVRVREPHFHVFDEFRNASYAKRYEILCRRLVRERQYSAACFLLADPSHAHARDNYREPDPSLSATTFLSQLIRHVARPSDFQP